MKYFLQNKTGDEVDRIVARLNKLMDGDISGQMRNKGVDYKLNYGASVLWLKNLANEYQGDNDLAERLWLREIRETMIIATLVARPDKDFIKKIDFWMKGLVSDELAEQIGVNLLWRMGNIIDYSFSILKEENERQHAAIWISLAVFMQRGGVLKKEEVLDFIRILKQDLYDSRLAQRAKGRFLRQLCRRDKYRIPEIEKLLVELSAYEKLSWLIQDVSTEIIYLKNS